MPASWTIDEHARLTTVTIAGRFTLPEAQQTLLELYAQPSYNRPMVDLWDLREAQLEAGPGDMLRFVRFMLGRSGGARTDRTALVVVAGGHQFGLSRMYQTYADTMLSLPVSVFTDVDQALAWLGE